MAVKKMKLFERSAEIFNALPEEYAEIIINSLIARSVNTGLLFDEVSLYVSQDRLEEVVEKISKKASFKPVRAKDVSKRGKQVKKIEVEETTEDKKKEKGISVFSF